MHGISHTRATRCTTGVWVWLALVSCTGFVQADPAKPTPGAKQSHAAFLAGLEGPWQGQARVTPIGPRPYDMTYVEVVASFVHRPNLR